MNHYAPYGEVWGEQGTVQAPFGFTGEPTDQNSLVHLRARYYNPMLGVFPNLDPVEGDMAQPASLNRYSYVQNNPINFVDKSGRIRETPNSMSCIPQQDRSGGFYCNALTSAQLSLSEQDRRQLFEYGVSLTNRSPAFSCGPELSSDECVLGCWTPEKVAVVLQSVMQQAVKIASVGGNLRSFLPPEGLVIVMTEHIPEDRYAALTPVPYTATENYISGPPRIVFWENGENRWATTGVRVFSPELVTHEFGHVLQYTERGQKARLHRELTNVSGGNSAILTTADGTEYAIWAPFLESGLDYPEGPEVTREQHLRAHGRLYGRRGFTLPLDELQGERAAEGYAVWVHDDPNGIRQYNVNDITADVVAAQIRFWETFFSSSNQ